MKKYFFIALAILLHVLPSSAQQADSLKPVKIRKHSIGLGLGFTTGIGLTYRYMPDKLGFQLTAGGFKDNNSSLGSGGLTLLYNILATEKLNFFSYYSNSIWYRTYEYYMSSNPVYDPVYGYYQYHTSYETRSETLWNTGLGLGVEFLASKKVGFNFMLGWAGYDTFRLILPTGETCILIKF